VSSEADPRQEYAALLRAVAARVELEQGFGIESWRLPLPPLPSARPPSPEATPRPAEPQAVGKRQAATGSEQSAAGSRQPAGGSRQPAAPRPPVSASAPPKAPEPQAALDIATGANVDLFQAKDYDIQFPEGLTKQGQLDHFAKAIAGCTLCPLHAKRTQVVFGVGNPDAELMFVGEAPGQDEDEQGEPFVGRAGQLLNKIITAMGYKRADVYIGNVNKCRPPDNRAPLPDEMDRCRPFLLRQIDIVRPKVICLLGATAVRGLLQSKDSISSIRGRFLRWRGILVMPTFHPAYLLRNPGEKRTVWEDVQKVRDLLRGKLTV